MSGAMTTVPVVQLTDALKAAATAVRRNAPFLLVRLGDTELAVLEHPDSDIDVNEPHINWPAGWHMTDAAIVELAKRYDGALRDADSVGMIWSDWDTTARIARAVEAHAGGSVRSVCSTLGFRRPLDEGIDELRLVVKGRRVFCIGAKTREWARAIQLLGGKPCPWPYDESGGVASLRDYEEVLAWALALYRRDPSISVALVVLGPWAPPLCHELWRVGLVALDLGAGLTVLPDVLPAWVARLAEGRE